jgi:hypothetical protein
VYCPWKEPCLFRAGYRWFKDCEGAVHATGGSGGRLRITPGRPCLRARATPPPSRATRRNTPHTMGRISWGGGSYPRRIGAKPSESKDLFGEHSGFKLVPHVAEPTANQGAPVALSPETPEPYAASSPVTDATPGPSPLWPACPMLKILHGVSTVSLCFGLCRFSRLGAGLAETSRPSRVFRAGGFSHVRTGARTYGLAGAS